MAARSSSSPRPPPQDRQSGPWPLHVGQGTEVHAVRSEASGLAGSARECVAGKSDVPWRGEEGPRGQRGRGGAAVQVPLLSAPMASRRLEGIPVEEAMATRMQLLEEELSSLREELALCQVLRVLASGLSPPLGPGPVGVRPSPSCLGSAVCRYGTHPTPAVTGLPAPTRSPAGSPAPRPGLPPLSGRGRQGSSPRPAFGFRHLYIN
ncbi:centlein-like [Orycteropus afer afer]|uniref:Centlein-like n=1 Tax=Orycteropus afer afer TaxID=1230840 RepID=A0A8B7B125_ORYAF|nr:centlein-like [Orycteropus afer afer]